MGQTAIYGRISSDVANDELGVRRQEKACRELCERQDWRDVVVYIDNDVSAYSGKKRPEYLRMLDDIKDGVVERLVVWNPDRLHRSMRDLEDFIDLIEATGCAVATATAGSYDLTTPDGRAMARVIAAFNRKESEDKTRRLRAKHAELAEGGRPSGGGKRPYGYTRKLGPTGHIEGYEINAAEAAIIREAMGRLLAGEGISSLCHDMNARGVKAAMGGTWSQTTMRTMLKSGRISGQREHRGEIITGATWPAIVDPAETERARTILKGGGPRGTPRTYPLSGLVYCGRCGFRMVTGTTTGGKRRYNCTAGAGRASCGRMATIAEPLDALVVETVLQAIDTPEFAELITDRTADITVERSKAAAVIVACEAKLAELDDAYADPDPDKVITMAAWMAARGRVEARIEDARREASGPDRAVIVPFIGKSSALRAKWSTLPVTQQQALIAAVIDKVLVDPVTAAAPSGSRRFDPARIRMTWKA